MKNSYPLDIVYIKVSVNRKLLDPIGKISFKTGYHFPTITLRKEMNKQIKSITNSIHVLYNGLTPILTSEYPTSLIEINGEKDLKKQATSPVFKDFKHLNNFQSQFDKFLSSDTFMLFHCG